MIQSANRGRSRRLPNFAIAWLLVLISGVLVNAQQNNIPSPPEREDLGRERISIDAAEIQSVMNDEPVADEAPTSAPSGIDLLSLIMRGGVFMIPIGVMSLMVVALAFERLVSLRQQRILPRGLARDLNELRDPMELFDPAAALQSCREFPSPASRVFTAMLQRTGQPLSEIEQAANDTIQREADKCGSPIRWLTLAAAATPLMGLLGTVWGMIVAFHESTTLTPDRSRSEQLSEGIYTALVTTLAGLIVAIPAAILCSTWKTGWPSRFTVSRSWFRIWLLVLPASSVNDASTAAESCVRWRRPLRRAMAPSRRHHLARPSNTMASRQFDHGEIQTFICCQHAQLDTSD